jgi:hypothetical protein
VVAHLHTVFVHGQTRVVYFVGLNVQYVGSFTLFNNGEMDVIGIDLFLTVITEPVLRTRFGLVCVFLHKINVGQFVVFLSISNTEMVDGVTNRLYLNLLFGTVVSTVYFSNFV